MITANVKSCLAATTGICSALLSLFAPQAEARDPLRESIRDASGREILVLEQTYNGKRPKYPSTRVPHDPEQVDTDFYQLTYRNLTQDPIIVKRFAQGLRYGAGSLIGQQSSGSTDSWGAGLQERDLVKQPMFGRNMITPDRPVGGEVFIYGRRSPNYLDRVMEIEHLGKRYELKWGMRYSSGEK